MHGLQVLVKWMVNHTGRPAQLSFTVTIHNPKQMEALLSVEEIQRQHFPLLLADLPAEDIDELFPLQEATSLMQQFAVCYSF